MAHKSHNYFFSINLAMIPKLTYMVHFMISKLPLFLSLFIGILIFYGNITVLLMVNKVSYIVRFMVYSTPLVETKTASEDPGGWWQSKSALNQSKDILFFRMASTLIMTLFTLASLIFE